MTQVPFASGSSVNLRGLQRDDFADLAAWINDPEVTSLMFMGYRPALAEDLVSSWESRRGRDDEIELAVCLNDSAFIGTTGLYSINWIMRSAEFRIFLGDKGAWGKGAGTEATKLVVAYAFEKLNLNRVWLGVNVEQAAARRIYEKAGFSEEGILRQEQYRNFRYYDVLRMAILREEYERLRDGYLSTPDR